MRVLTVNAGSSSLKLSLLDHDDETITSAELAAPQARVDDGKLRDALRANGLDAADAVGHRIVHGGARFTEAVAIDDSVERALRGLVDLAPLHQPKSLAALDAVSAALPDLPAVACFDTSFHTTIPEAARTYALPAEWRERWELRRFGFHGLSHGWVARRVDAPRVVSCHLGAGASLCAIRDGRSIATTMGFTPLEGLTMATRSGSIDPGLILWLLEHGELDEATLASALEHKSGLLGLTGTADMRDVLERAAAGDERAILGRDVYLHHLRAGVAAMAATLGGLDALAFTGGVGERAAEIRARAADGLAFLGVALDDGANAGAQPGADISAPEATVHTYVIAAREDREIARQVRALLAR
ncbi:MAG TPA: acetate/propionate family kinase [Baekduia sp.]|nr:acetate/propionate family kinase [Baekduia sp.]